jgi:hypothetical protein
MLKFTGFGLAFLLCFSFFGPFQALGAGCPDGQMVPSLTQSMAGGRTLLLCGSGKKVKDEWHHAIGQLILVNSNEEVIFELSLPGSLAPMGEVAQEIDGGGDLRFDRSGFSLIRFINLLDGERISALEESYSCEGKTCKRVGPGKCLLPERWPSPDLMAVREVRTSLVPKQGLPDANQLRLAFEATLGGNKEARQIFMSPSFRSVLGEKTNTTAGKLDPENQMKMGQWIPQLLEAGCWKKVKEPKRLRRKKKRR